MICKKIKGQLKGLLAQFDNYLENNVDTALKISSELKSILSSPVADIVTAIIPGTVDDAVRNELVQALSKVVDALTIADSCRQSVNANEKLCCFVQQLKLRDPRFQDAMLQKFASLLAGSLDGERLEQSLYDLFTQAKYTVENRKA